MDVTSSTMQVPAHPVVLITGGAGFVGHALVRELLKSASEGGILQPREIRVFDPRPSEYEGHERVRCLRGDVRDLEALREACQAVDLVFNCAALVDWGRQPESLLDAVNIGGVENVVRACRAAGVTALVHTSTLDAVYSGRAVLDGDESLPYPDRFVNGYCRTKAAGEQVALRANGAPLVGREGTLRTLVLRPSSIIGERDPYHVTSLMQMARGGWMVRIGDGRARSQHVYVGNVAHAHCVAGRALLEGRGAGQAYFITDFPPKNFFDFLEPILNACGYRFLPWSLALPRPLMMAVGTTLEAVARWIRPVVSFTPTVTRFAVDYVCLDFTLSGAKLQRELGYQPLYGEAEAFARTIAWFRGQPFVSLARDTQPGVPAAADDERAPAPPA